MTRHAPHHADYVTRKLSHTVNSNRSKWVFEVVENSDYFHKVLYSHKFSYFRNPWILDRQYAANTNTISSTNSLQSRVPAFCTVSGPGPPIYQGNASEQQLRCSPMQLANVRSMTMPRLPGQKLYPAYVERAPSVRTNPTSVPRTRTPKYFDHVSGLNSGCSTSRTSSDRPITPVSLSTTDGIVDPCGGHCRTFERCCRYLLQVSDYYNYEYSSYCSWMKSSTNWIFFLAPLHNRNSCGCVFGVSCVLASQST